MSNDKYAYHDDEVSQTDSYLENLAGKPREKPQYNYEPQMDVQSSNTWYSDADNKPAYQNNLARVIVIGVSVFMLLVGAGVAIFARVQKDKNIISLCPHCDDLITGMYVFGGALAAFAIMGIVSAVTRFKPIAFFFALLVFIMALACAAAGFAVVAFDTGVKEADIEHVWNTAVEHKEKFVCDAQGQLKCSGYYKCCGTSNTTTTGLMVAPGQYSLCNLTQAEYKTTCDVTCTDSNQQFVEPCHEKIADEIKKYYKPVMGILFGLAVLLLLTAICAVRMTLRSRVARNGNF